MIIKNDTEFLDFDILEYEFEYNKDDDGYDNNWLITKVRMSNIDGTEIYVDVKSAEILAYELENLSKEISKMKSFSMDFLEPYIELNVIFDSKNVEWTLVFLYNIDLVEKEVRIFTKKFNQEEYIEFSCQIKDLSISFPVR